MTSCDSNRFFGRASILACLALGIFVLSGCAKATITPEQTAAAPVGVQQRPDKIVVYDFQVSADEVTENQGPLQRAYDAATKDEEQETEARLATGREAAHDLSGDLVKQLQALGFDAEVQPRGTPVSGNVLIIDGQFVTADEGNRARRMIIGFGAGASKLETQVRVSQTSAGGAATQLLSFRTQSDSGKMPGAAVTMGAGAAAQGATAASAVTAATSAGKVYTSMLSTLADKTSKQITAYLSQYFATQGWLSSDQAHKAAVAG
ncbi:MAG: DUF4410 domain-containing protein [Candidatus Binataceae bacterium]